MCYNSGKGYYKQEGDLLTCQNCGNQFSRDDVEVVKGGCNPVPITDEYKTVTDETVVLLSHKNTDTHIKVNVEFGEGEGKIPVDKIAEKIGRIGVDNV